MCFSPLFQRRKFRTIIPSTRIVNSSSHGISRGESRGGCGTVLGPEPEAAVRLGFRWLLEVDILLRYYQQ